MTASSTARRPLACYHEAGHCLARWYFGRQFDRAVVLSPREIRAGKALHDRRGRSVIGVEGFVDGYDVLSPFMSPGLLERMEGEPAMVASLQATTWAAVEVELTELYAGPVAEARQRKTSLTAVLLAGGDGDHARIRKVLDTWYPDPAVRREADRLAERRAVALVRSAPGWTAVGAMARHIEARGELSWDVGAALCEQAYGWAWAFRGNATTADLPTTAAVRAGLAPSAVGAHA